jgi:hypothetical protein
MKGVRWLGEWTEPFMERKQHLTELLELEQQLPNS